MIGKWLRFLIWQPYALFCRRFPLWPFRVTVTQPVEYVTCIQIDNLLTRLLSRFSGGYDYAVCYLVDGSLLIDTGFPWARRSLKQALIELGAVETITTVVNTHYHEDHTGNNDLLVELCKAQVLVHPDAIPEIRFPVELRWYRSFLFGPTQITDASPIGASIKTEHAHFDVIETPGHCPGHICLFEPDKKYYSAEISTSPPTWTVNWVMRTALNGLPAWKRS